MRGLTRRFHAALACAILAAGCGTAGKRATPGENAPVQREGVLVCDGHSTRLLTPRVQPQADGLHLVVRNESGGELDFEYSVIEADGGDGGGGGDALRVGTTREVLPFAAASFTVTCGGGGTERIEVVDRAGESKSAKLDCSTRAPTIDVRAAGPVRSDPVTVARRELRARGMLSAGDVLERAVSPGPEFPIVRVVRAGRVVAAVRLNEADGGKAWLVSSIERCPGFAARR